MPSRVQLSCGPVDCSPPGSSVHGISQARILEWITISPSPGDLPNPRMEITPPAWQVDSFTPEPPGKPSPHLKIQRRMQIDFPKDGSICLLPSTMDLDRDKTQPLSPHETDALLKLENHALLFMVSVCTAFLHARSYTGSISSVFTLSPHNTTWWLLISILQGTEVGLVTLW